MTTSSRPGTLVLLVVALAWCAEATETERAWVRFSPERSSFAATPGYTDGWAVIRSFALHPAGQKGSLGMASLIGLAGRSTPLLAEDVVAATYFDRVDVHLLLPDGDQESAGILRLHLERVHVIEQLLGWDGDPSCGPTKRLNMTYGAITFIYIPGPSEPGSATFSENDSASGGSRSGLYENSGTTGSNPLYEARLSRDDAQEGRLRLSWESEPGVRYAIQFTDDLTRPFQTVQITQFLGHDGRLTELSVPDRIGFYRVIMHE